MGDDWGRSKGKYSVFARRSGLRPHALDRGRYSQYRVQDKVSDTRTSYNFLSAKNSSFE